jgi:uncharacterized iron-regulated membrane protein
VKLSADAFLKFYELHAWAGVLTGLVLYVMFLAGGFTLFHEQLETWEEPLAQRQGAPRSLDTQLFAGLAAMGSTPTALWFTPGAEPHFDWQDESGTWRSARLDSERGVLVAQRERLAHFTYALHYLWHDLTGMWLYTVAGLLGLVWLVVIATGVLVHVKDVARQFHQFRPEKRGRPFWSDLHKVLGTMGLPFQTVMAWSGAFIILGPMVMKLFVGPVFGGDESKASLVSEGYPSLVAPAPGAVVPVLGVDALDAKAKEHVSALDVHAYRLVNHGRDNGRFEAWGRGKGSPRGQVLVQLDEVSGALVVKTGEHASSELRRWLVGLHFAQFGGIGVRLLFLVLTLASCLTIISGNWIWTSRRGASPRRVLSRLTVGVGAGAWVAFGALLVASRALPLSWGHRTHAEELVFFGALVGCVAWATLARDERALWWKQLSLAAAAWVATPMLAALHSSAGLFGRGPRLAEVVGVDVVVLLLGVALGGAALLLRPRVPSMVVEAEAQHVA